MMAVLLVQPCENAAARAYEALRASDYDRAIASFRKAITAEPEKAALRKDLAYTYLRAGETAAARDEFAEAVRLDPADRQAALEYGFLCYETNRRAEARRVFDRLRKAGDARAAVGFENIDRPLAEGIARWRAVIAKSPDNYSARRELARLAEERGELELAAENCLGAWRLKPSDRDLLVDLGRVWQALGRATDANAALLAASRGSTPRAADAARDLLPARYPYVDEFRRALELDSRNIELRRELAYLLLAMGRQPDAESEFRRVLEIAPGDRLAAAQLGFLLNSRGERAGATALFERVLAGGEDELSLKVRGAIEGTAGPSRATSPAKTAPAARSSKDIGLRSYDAGMLRDAAKYLTAAHDEDPLDFSVMLKLGWTQNLLKNDRAAFGWFRLASRSPDPAVAAEAARAFRSLRPAQSRVRTTFWAFPFWSSRWHDAFTYAQVKTEARLGSLPVRPYVSVRFIGDTRQAAGEASPQFLSETAFIVAAGIATPAWRGLTLWGEAGEAMSYRKRAGRVVPDYRGGIAFSRGFGTPLQGEGSGWVAETAVDAVFLSRFGNDVVAYWQNRAGYTLPAVGGLRSQLYVNVNVSADAKREYWANVAEFGPGLRFRLDPLPAVFSVNLLRGAYTRNFNNPRGPNFVDVRAGFWYAFSR